MTAQAQTLTVLDAVLLLALAASALLGLWRGLVFELISLAGWLGAWLLSRSWGGQVAALLPWGGQEAPWRPAAGVILTFVACLALAAVAARVARMLIAATPLSALDRLLGAVFGLARGGLVLMLAVWLVNQTPVARQELWQGSWAVAGLQVGLQGFLPLVPSMGWRVSPGS